MTAARVEHIKEKVETVKKQMRQLRQIGKQMSQAPDGQISLTDPDARSMATSGRGTGMVGYNVQAAVDSKHHMIVAHGVTNVGHDREQAGIKTLVPKPQTSNNKAAGLFDKADFRYIPSKDEYQCPAGKRAIWRYTTVENGRTIHKYWTSACFRCPIKAQCTTNQYRRITRWEHEDVLEAMQKRLDRTPKASRIRRQTVEHPFGTLKAWMGATHFLTKTLPRVSTEMSLHRSFQDACHPTASNDDCEPKETSMPALQRSLGLPANQGRFLDSQRNVFSTNCLSSFPGAFIPKRRSGSPAFWALRN